MAQAPTAGLVPTSLCSMANSLSEEAPIGVVLDEGVIGAVLAEEVIGVVPTEGVIGAVLTEETRSSPVCTLLQLLWLVLANLY